VNDLGRIGKRIQDFIGPLIFTITLEQPLKITQYTLFKKAIAYFYIQSKALINEVPTKGNITQHHSGSITRKAAVKTSETKNPNHHSFVDFV